MVRSDNNYRRWRVRGDPSIGAQAQGDSRGGRGGVLANGYLGTSMDEIAALARVSKQTVYKNFAHKEQLFVEIVTTTVNQISDPVHEEVLNLADSGDIEADLRDLACRLLNGVMQPRLLNLRRLVIGEAGRFPQLGRTFYERGPGRTIAALATAFERLAARDVLRLEDPELAANHFNWLIMSATPSTEPAEQQPATGRADPPVATE